MKTSEKDSVFLKKLATGFIKLGDIHANKFSTLSFFYEPKIPTNLLKSNK
ncbi:AgrD family cyclic lactone autoinducer peptide [Clostridium vincentii]|uniref:Cyclic lactone autoinducer peptide n=1 Tax=Clostridium vincentii TaxID=52704 RepID=A0A2T0BH51_9CLOT|nr:cyclic lactone autoinducer peptide [Clostridium vincentii]PRR83241.1 hypothetical protein CLVI_10400 [Clostridium vincentii]